MAGRGRPYQPVFPAITSKVMTLELAKLLWTYKPETGVFLWNVAPRVGVNVGDFAGAIGQHGYRILCFKRKKYKAARVAWLMVKGAWPTPEVDHIDGCRENDRIGNLREATRTQQLCNTRTRLDNALGVKGVVKAKDGKFEAYICVNGKRKNLGRYDTVEEAKAVYDATAVAWHGEFRRMQPTNTGVVP